MQLMNICFETSEPAEMMCTFLRRSSGGGPSSTCVISVYVKPAIINAPYSLLCVFYLYIYTARGHQLKFCMSDWGLNLKELGSKKLKWNRFSMRIFFEPNSFKDNILRAATNLSFNLPSWSHL